MKISQKNLLRIILLAVVAIYCTLMFFIVDDYTPNFWIIFCFTLIAPLMLFTLTFFNNVSSKHIGINIAMIRLPIIHAAGQLILHITLFFKKFPTPLLVVIEVVFTLVLVIYAATLGSGTKEVSRRIEEQKTKIRYLNTLQITLTTAYESVTDSEVKSGLSTLIEKVSYSQFDSIPQVQQLELEMLQLANNLLLEEKEGQLAAIKRLTILLNQRNNMVSMMG